MNNLVAKKVVEVKGEEKELQIYKLNASEGILVATKLSKLILPVLGGLADEVFSEDDKGAPKTFSDMAQKLMMQLDNSEILAIMKKLLKDASVNRSEIDFDSYFMSNYGELFLFLEFALKENFQSFFEVAGLKTRFSKIMGAMTAAE